MAGITEPPYPLHPSISSRIHPEYAAFYNKYIINNQQVHLQPVSASRTSGILIPGGGPVLPVGKTEDIYIKRVETEGPDVLLRVFTPETPAPEGGYGVMLYMHGGGWVLGNINTENTVCTNICKRAGVVVVSVDYRLAPEHPFPAAVHDCWEALLWLHQPLTITTLTINPAQKLSVGGSSAGGNLAAVLTHKSLLEKPGQINIVKQALSVPVTDNTATTSNNWAWKEFEFTAALPAQKMMWYRKHYLPDGKDWGNPEASPLLYGNEDGHWAKLPPAVIVVGELDVLRGEGEAYAAKLKENGVEAEVHVMKGMPHPFLAMDAVLEAGREAITLLVEAVKSSL
ncbi:lipase, putative [Talaromyces stipitatus ATCC 10500]|uniref:Lipase, putative n=1 Tax=Talaromyces stipitatus (strain ATCC 10500 / CBS 375.48 / QM 6759 / NRRL 1006) TaxID=441959 RepID=B8MNI2_TALSN|nr:lipase, putative [Talaromyces stipitatus ATCC 10500]EED14071.1 lipase, putative [Talaromyces stipitatus ATCC 10500]